MHGEQYRVTEPELGNDLLAALRRPADTAALYAAAYDAAVEIEGLRKQVAHLRIANARLRDEAAIRKLKFQKDAANAR